MNQGLFNRLFVITEWITRISFSNILWFLFNLPIVYLVFNLFVSQTPGQLLANLLFIVILTPFTLFPSTMALFGVARKWAMGERYIKLMPTFWKYYRENFFRSILGGLILTVLWFFLAIDYYYFSASGSPLFYLFLVVGVFMIAFTVNFFAITVHYDIKLFATIKNCFKLAIGRPVHTIGMAALLILLVYVSFNVFPFLLFLGIGSIAAFGTFSIFYKGLELKEDNEEEKNEDNEPVRD